MAWYQSVGCHPPDWQSEMHTIVVDSVMLILSFLCLMVTIYGTYRYIKDHRALKANNVKPTKALYVGGLIFFIVSSITLLNAMIYDAMYLICPRLDDIEGPIYHSVYFLQIFCLWIVLFLRVYSIFKTSEFQLSRTTIAVYIITFIAVIITTIPFYFIYESRTDSVIALPYVTLSALFAGMLLITFVCKLVDIFSKFGVDEHLLKTMVKNTLLAAISIACTFLVIIALVVLYVKHEGNYHDRYSIFEELTLELFILIDIISNFICVLLSYTFFDQKFQKLCGSLNDKLYDVLSHKIEESLTSQLPASDDKHISSKDLTISIGKTGKQPHEGFITNSPLIQSVGNQVAAKPLTENDANNLCRALFDNKLSLNPQQDSAPVRKGKTKRSHFKLIHSQSLPRSCHC